jgi:mannose-6-phosphate isomerase-like protein (cupin superfamily)
MSHSVGGARGHKTRGSEAGTSKKRIAHVGPAEGVRSRQVFGELVTCKVTSDRTGGAYSLFEVTTQPGEGPPPHVHHREDESFYVLEGEYEFFSGEGIIRVGAGSLLCVPRGALHAHKNVGTGVGRLLATQTPGGLYERFFEEVGEAVDGDDGGPPAFEDRPDARTIMEIVEIAAAHGIEIPPPIAAQ